jgi:hypothetical protein
MSARIMIDLDRVHPVSADGRWHRVAQLRQLPKPGEPITMFCGQVEQAEYVSPAEQTTTGTVETCCWACDLIYRRLQGIQIRPDHPGLHGQPPPPMPIPRQDQRWKR